jgi:branched-chain amino acid transport system ATP-binding protein
MNAAVPALQATSLRKAYGGLVVTNGVDLTLHAGARHALIGPNGAGKSTLVGLLSGVIHPDDGQIQLSGQNVTRMSLARRVKSGLVRTFQVSSLFTGLTVLENIYLAVSEQAGASRRLWRAAAKEAVLLERAESLLESVGLQDARGHLVDELPYGQQRLLEIALALALEPKVLLLDEPAAGIPSAQTAVLLDALDKLPQNIAILLIEHDMQVVRRFATQVTVLVEGSILMSGSPQAVMDSAEVKAVYLGTTGAQRFGQGGAHA